MAEKSDAEVIRTDQKEDNNGTALHSNEKKSHDDLASNSCNNHNEADKFKGSSEVIDKATDSQNPTAKLFLRPSALSRDSGDPPSIVKPESLNTISSSCNNNGNSEESLLNIGSNKNEKVEPTPIMNVTTPAVTRVFVPLSNPNYVFGQNIKDRVVVGGDSSANSNGDMLFTSAVTLAESSWQEKTEEKESSSLLEDAARCELQRNTKRKYEAVHTTTGEENETNILQIVVKLFAFEGGSWVERGRGSLRLNDSGGGGSRIVIRTLGSLRVILNTKIWAGMQVSRASEKSIRTTALDAAGVLRVFLIQGCPSDIETLFNSIETRVKRSSELETAHQVEECSSTTSDMGNEKGEQLSETAAPPAKVAALDSSV